MDNQQPSSSASPAASFSAHKQQATRKTVAQLLDDKNAMDDWVTNIEKIRQKESGGATRHAA